MIRKFPLILLLITSFLSCIGEKYLVNGSYHYKNYPKTTLELRDDGKFEYIDLSFFEVDDLRGDIYTLRTLGNWVRDSLQFVYLNSYQDTIMQNDEIIKRTPNNLENSVFTFFDIQGDTINVNYQLKNDGTMITGVGIYQFSSWEAYLNKNDTIVLSCLGYDYWTYVKKDSVNYNFDVLLYPEYRPDYFKNYPLEIKGKRLINRNKHNHKLIKD